MTNLRYFGEPVMYAVRSDVRTPDEKARLVYAWLQIAKDHMPEVMIPNKGYRGNRDRPDFIFGSDLFAAIYTWKDIPNFEEFSKRLHENGDTALCIASVSSNDTERVGLLEFKGMMALTVYGSEMQHRHEEIFDELDFAYDQLAG